MTESDWLECADPMPMMELLKHSTKHRSLYLLACTCCRQVWDLLVDERSRRAIELTEGFVDKKVGEDEFRVAAGAAHNACCQLEIDVDEPGYPAPQFGKGHVVVAFAAWDAASADNYKVANSVVADVEEMLYLVEKRESLLANIIRDIFNPFRPISINPIWLTPTVTSLAQAAHDERIMPSGELKPDRLAVLSDALEEAGCDHADILNHLRSSGLHVRGCWVLDLLLGEE